MRIASVECVAMAAAMTLAGCTGIGGNAGTVRSAPGAAPDDADAPSPPARTNDWRTVATPADRARLRGWYAAWQAALASAHAAGNGADIAREGVLLDPMAALPNAHLPPGDYACRVIKLGARGSGGLGYVAYPAFRCRVEAEQDIFSFTKLTGSQRHVGLIFEDSERRKIFLGTLMLGDETRALDYGVDASRDLAGLVERIGPERWRITFPRPAFESLVDVMELTPAP